MMDATAFCILVLSVEVLVVEIRDTSLDGGCPLHPDVMRHESTRVRPDHQDAMECEDLPA